MNKKENEEGLHTENNQETNDSIEVDIERAMEGISAEEIKKNKKATKVERTQKIDKLSKERDEYKDKYIRKLAEFDNYRKRIEKERKEYYCYPTADVIKLMLPVLDSFECALNLECKIEESQIKEGMELIHKQMMNILKAMGLKPITALGEKFDPNYHQAVATESSSEHDENQVIEEIQRGYLFRDKLLRPSLVKVAVTTKEEEQEVQDTTEDSQEDNN